MLVFTRALRIRREQFMSAGQVKFLISMKFQRLAALQYPRRKAKIMHHIDVFVGSFSLHASNEA